MGSSKQQAIAKIPKGALANAARAASRAAEALKISTLKTQRRIIPVREEKEAKA
jgi:hypothetical protein